MAENVRHLPYRLADPSSRDTPGRFTVTASEAERFWSKVALRSGPGCWLWQGAPNASGYGTFALTGGRVRRLAHRYAYELLVAPIGPGLTLDHLCEQPLCVRPSHLEPVTASENLRRRHARRRAQIGAT